MIRVYIAEGEKLVRWGLISLIDWAGHGMEVAGDAGSGEEALAFLEREGADLLFAGMELQDTSGIEFLKRVRESLPGIQIVALAVRQDFAQIQQALRLGVLDYVTRAQLQEDIDRFMERVVQRCLGASADRLLEADRVFVLQSGERSGGAEYLAGKGLSWERLDGGWLLLSGRDGGDPDWEGIAEGFREGEAVLEISGVRGLRRSRLEERLRTAAAARLFQDYAPGCFLYAYSWRELAEWRPGRREELGDFWKDMAFLAEDARFEEGMERICRALPSGEERIVFFYRLALCWAEFSGKDMAQYVHEVEGFCWWYQWREWCALLRDRVLERTGRRAESARNAQEIHRAVCYIREHMGRDISLEELLRLTGMSKSHFSKSFKRLTGKTFIAYLNGARIDAAKRYLRETGQPVSWIAAQVGFGDEHYFRKLFRRNTGLSPRAFRKGMDDCI